MTRARDLANIADGTFTATDLDLSGTLTVSGDANFDTNTLFVDVSANNVGIGTTTVNEKLVLGSADSGSNFLQITNSTTTAADNRGFYVGIDANENARIIQRENADMFFSTNNTEGMTLDASGNVGIGTTSPSFATGTGLEIQRTTATATVRLEYTGSNAFELSSEQNTVTYNSVSSKPHVFEIGSAEKARIDASGNVGIGTSSPATALDMLGDLTVRRAAASTQYTQIQSCGGESKIIAKNGAAASYQALIFESGNNTATTERMRIDASGRLLVGKSASNDGTEGVEIRSNEVLITNDGGTTLSLNRLSSDGTILGFAKDGTTVGSISSINPAGTSTLTIGGASFYGVRLVSALSGGEGFVLIDNGSTTYKFEPTVDDRYDLGASGNRLDNIYATNGTIQTSDANEKQDISELDEAERRVAVAAKGLLRKFRWKSAVEKKGDEARIHFGIIAQDLQAAFEAEGLDAGRYAMFIHSTWTDEETGEERSRMGVRYSELLAFILAAL